MTKQKKVKKNSLETRPPIVVILGHVDHGKTSILDYIRKTKIADRESGGITQHIGAYQIEHQDKLITFIDTPGHEAFSAMRSRGAKVADIAILVIAAEEGLKPQTKEAIDHIKKGGIPVIVALNKIDKKEALPEKVKQQLAENDILVESMGGQIPSVNISAKNGQGIDQMLEMINLVAELEELRGDRLKTATGVIIESHLDHQKGPTATVLIKEGILNKQDVVATGSAFGKVKSMRDFKGQEVDQACFSCPIIITGFDKVPQIGEKFEVFENLEDAQAKVAQKTAKRKEDKEVLVIENEKKVLNIVLKADVQGSLEAIKESLKTIPADEVIPRIVKAEVGQINESDIKLAESAKGRIIGFRVKASASIKQIAQNRKIKISTYEIIYELIQNIREALERLLAPEIVKTNLGQLKVLALFASKKNQQVIGGRVLDGQAKNGVKFEIIRQGEKIGQGKITQLQRNKNDVPEVNKGAECGILAETQTNIEKGDLLEMYQEEKQKREL